MKKLVLILIYTLIFTLYSSADAARINKVSIVQRDTTEFQQDLISNRNQVLLKYLLSDTTVFKIEGEWFEGFNFRWSLIVIVDGVEYESTVYDIRNSTDTLYFNSRNIRDLLLESESDFFGFKFCPRSFETGVWQCTQTFTLRVEDESNWFNDTYANFQYYLKDSNITRAKKSVQSIYTPVVAVIDDGIYIDHEDLQGNIWTNQQEIIGNGIDDDNNGYIDDYYGWNFIDDSNIMTPKWSHGTNVAWLIGANSNNRLWIAWVWNDVKLMALTTCDRNGCQLQNIIKAINYAIDQDVDIINMSIAWNWFIYNSTINAAIQRAKDRGITIVVSAWNGDGDLSGNGLDTWEFKISPVCNETERSDIIGVSALSLFSALSANGARTSWTNFGICSDIFAYWERITTLSLTWSYDILDGTSFSAPIISGVIALWYNKYWKMSWENVYNALLASTSPRHGIDAFEYLDQLERVLTAQERINNSNITEPADSSESPNTQQSQDFTALYNRLENLERQRPGILRILLPALQGISDNPSYARHQERIQIIIAYIQENH